MYLFPATAVINSWPLFPTIYLSTWKMKVYFINVSLLCFGRHSTTWAMHPTHSSLFFAGPLVYAQASAPPIYVSHIAGSNCTFCPCWPDLCLPSEDYRHELLCQLFLFFEMVSLCCPGWSQTHGDPPASVSWVAEITGVYHHTWLPFHIFIINYFEFYYLLR
jgi:hypothetical protein